MVTLYGHIKEYYIAIKKDEVDIYTNMKKLPRFTPSEKDKLQKLTQCCKFTILQQKLKTELKKIFEKRRKTK